jgi:hypothetical protein
MELEVRARGTRFNIRGLRRLAAPGWVSQDMASVMPPTQTTVQDQGGRAVCAPPGMDQPDLEQVEHQARRQQRSRFRQSFFCLKANRIKLPLQLRFWEAEELTAVGSPGSQAHRQLENRT